jgi:Aldo/keto reductase family
VGKKVSANIAGHISLGGEISVNRLGFGAMRLTDEGIWGPPKDRKGALAVLRRAVELDVNFIDTADSYGPHISEELIAPLQGGRGKSEEIAPGPHRHNCIFRTLSSRLRRRSKRWLSCETKERFAWSRCPTSRKNTLSEHAKLPLPFPYRTAIALPTGNETT